MSFKPQNALVWCEIPVRDLEKSVKFYARALGYELKTDTTGPNPMAILPTADGMGVAGHLYPGTPSSDGQTVHLAVPGKLEQSTAAWEAAGGTMVSPPIAIPAGRFAYGKDIDGNSIGLFEMAG